MNWILIWLLMSVAFGLGWVTATGLHPDDPEDSEHGHHYR